MRHGAAGRRLRNRGGNGRRGGGGGGGNQQNRVFDSNGPDVRIRGTAHQIQEKYATLAKDAASSGDLILAESYLQHAEHYQRIINSWAEDMQRDQPVYNDGFEGHRQHQDRRFDSRAPQQQVAEEDDLGLPASITGDVQAVKARQTELADA